MSALGDLDDFQESVSLYPKKTYQNNNTPFFAEEES